VPDPARRRADDDLDLTPPDLCYSHGHVFVVDCFLSRVIPTNHTSVLSESLAILHAET
jgi:hypothetical protein